MLRHAQSVFLTLSQTRGGVNPYPETYEEFRVMDDFAYRFPYPFFVNGTGNEGYQYEVNWQAYNALSDLDLTVRQNGGSSGSYGWDGNVEVVDVDAAQLSPGGSYEIIVNPVTNRIPPGTRTNYFYWALAWTWVRDYAN